MIFTIKSLTFTLGTLVFEGWAAFLARCVCAALLPAAGWLARLWLRTRLFPRLIAHKWRFAPTPILVRSFAVPTQRMAFITGIYLALASLPWAASIAAELLFTAYEIAFTYCVCESLYKASELPELLVASSSEEIRSNKTLISLLSKVYKAVVIVLGGATIAQESGLPVGSILAGAGLVGLTVSLAAQDTASNLFSGLVILMERPFVLGDWVKIGDVEGEVVDINFRSTKIRALDNTIYILTNSNVSGSTINNATKRTKRLYRFALSVNYNTTRAQLEALMADLTELLRSSPYTYEDSVFVKLTEFASSSISITVSAYLRTVEYLRALEMQNELNLDIMDAMKRNGVEFALPSTNIYIKENSL